MKKILILWTFALLLLSGCNKADIKDHIPIENTQILSERLNIPETYSSEHVSETGKSVVTIDHAKVVVPSVYDVDLIEITPRIYTEDEMNDFLKRHGIAQEVVLNKSQEELYISYDFQKQLDEEPILTTISYFTDKDGNSDFYPPQMFTENLTLTVDLQPLVDEKAGNCTISLEEALSVADEEAQYFGEDFKAVFYGQTRTDAELAEGNVGLYIGSEQPQYYMFYYTREIDGIPVNFTSTLPSDEYDYVSGIEYLLMIVSDDGIEYSGYFSPQTVGGVVQNNIELMSFDEIVEIYENIAMLNLKSAEAYDNFLKNRTTVKEIRFGYMAVKQANSDSYILTPVWDFYGSTAYLYEDSAEVFIEDYENTDTISLSLSYSINAIDGTIIDRNLGY